MQKERATSCAARVTPNGRPQRRRLPGVRPGTPMRTPTLAASVLLLGLCGGYTAAAQGKGQRDAATSQPTTSELKRYDKKTLIKLGQKERYELIKSCRERLADLYRKIDERNRYIRETRPLLSGPDTTVWEAEIRHLETKVDDLEHPKAPYLPTLKLEAESVGVFRTASPVVEIAGTMNQKQIPADTLEVIQVIDADNMLVRLFEDRGSYQTEFLPRRGPQSGGHVGNWAVKWVPRGEDQVLWGAGYPTSGLVDDGFCKLDAVFEYSGTKQYVTGDGGSRTVHLVTKVEVEARPPGKKRK